ncbi:head-tail adaptor protein [Lactobacillus salivarius]|uniref:Head-tail adaptor protein n=1 Tax=Ligilactobacillus salivarius TaxID=1624 RepID=A0ABD6J9L8_9LACO|nr:phage head closure protein [Ligilactobacillus salivarius]MYY21828.1 head-tail adaptor protein [Ligilactobacillus salivarius]MYY73796.1 head-tail adaptor protein [Ligilactobacillus salivarius]NGG71984.1 phage head closure protein [Ligilactobacillus salivarius]
MPKKLLHSSFNQRIEFQTVSFVVNDLTGDTVEKPVTLFSCWCAPQRRTMSQQFQLTGLGLEDTLTVAIRHNSNVSKAILAKYKNDIYEVVSFSPDETNNYMAYDYIVIRKKKGSIQNG